MVISQTATYAIRAALCLAEVHGTGPMRVDDIADRLDVPRNYLSKILHVMARAQILKSTRGPGGGFRLAHEPEVLTLSQVIGQFDDLPEDSGCLLGREKCSDAEPCAAHDQWKRVSIAVRDFFDDTTLTDLLREHVPGAPLGPPR